MPRLNYSQVSRRKGRESGSCKNKLNCFCPTFCFGRGRLGGGANNGWMNARERDRHSLNWRGGDYCVIKTTNINLGAFVTQLNSLQEAALSKVLPTVEFVPRILWLSKGSRLASFLGCNLISSEGEGRKQVAEKSSAETLKHFWVICDSLSSNSKTLVLRLSKNRLLELGKNAGFLG